MKRETTLCFLCKGDTVCLAMKKRGFGEGKLNGVGGKVKDTETVPQAAIRETREEIGVEITEDQLSHAGFLDFHFPNNPDWNQRMHIFLTHDWNGEPTESEEMAPQWHRVEALPFETMWIDDQHWLPLVLAGKKIIGEFHFGDKGDTIEKFIVKEIEK